MGARPDNEVRKPLKGRGFRSGNFCPRELAEIKLRQNEAQDGRSADGVLIVRREVVRASATKLCAVLAREIAVQKLSDTRRKETPTRGAEISIDEAEGDARADGVLCVRRGEGTTDNDV